MERRFILFIVLAMAVIFLNGWLLNKLNPSREKAPPVAQAANQGPAAKPEKGPAEKLPEEKAVPPTKTSAKGAEEKLVSEKAAAAKGTAKAKPAEPAIPEEWVTLGSADPADPYRMLVTLSNRGAAVVRIELNGEKYRAIDDNVVPPYVVTHTQSGWLGHVVMDEGRVSGHGCRVDVVGPGTPAAKAGLRRGDVIAEVNGESVIDGRSLNEILVLTRPGQKVKLAVVRDGKPTNLTAELGWRPAEVVRPEYNDPLSFLMTLHQFDDQKLKGFEPAVDPAKPRELEGVHLREGTWQLDRTQQDAVTFRTRLSELGVEVSKTYRIEMVPNAEHEKADFPAYHLVLDVAVKNIGDQKHTVAYQLDGPTGLPIEGYWYASKITAGLRDLMVKLTNRDLGTVESMKIADDKFGPPWEGDPLAFIGVDAQYFAAYMIPQKASPNEVQFAQIQPLRVHDVTNLEKQTNPNWQKLMDTSCRLVSLPRELEPKQALEHSFVLFAGPKRPELMAQPQYKLEGTISYGWFHYVARALVDTLHVFYAVTRNYGLSIIMLTVLVRLCMFPLSKKQALGTLKMQQIQPELKKLQEKHKNNVEARTKAQQELFRKHNYHPLSGCLPAFIQLPIFVALYRGLMVDVELRQAPLLNQSIRWCSNLAGPDMAFNWTSLVPAWMASGSGFFGLGPYFNVLPIITIILFLWQQNKMMPPPADETAAAQQKMMKFMMIIMGVLFFKVASGLCLYFIASSLWGMAERKFLPKLAHVAPDGTPPVRELPAPRSDGRGSSPGGKRRSRGSK